VSLEPYLLHRILPLRSLLLNAAGTCVPAVVQSLAVPLYAALLGVEAYRVIALYLLMLTVVKVSISASE
jgi:hypothetical protein